MARLHRLAFVMPRPWSEAEIAALLASPYCFVLEAAGGFLIGRVVAGEAELLTVAVDPALQGHGIGSGLVARFVTEARNRQADSGFLEVAATNAVAQAVYRRAGFVETGRRRGYYHDEIGRVVDALVMTLVI
ncbi:MAG: ribosomal protein S18-alanine N-acetyltransferase [bacterium]